MLFRSDSKEAALWTVSGEVSGNNYGKKYEIAGRSALIRAFPLWVDYKVPVPIGDALLVVAKSSSDLSQIDPYISSYSKIRIKFILCDGIGDQAKFEAKWNAISIRKKVPIEFIEKLIEANNELVKVVAEIFKKFDKDNNGRIELSDIQAISKELGSELSEEEANSMMKILNIHGDKKICLEEFVSWWKTGCQGISFKMNSIINNMIRKDSIISNLMELTDLNKNTSNQIINLNLKFQLGKIESPGFSIGVVAFTSGKELDSEIQKYTEPTGISSEDSFIGLSFGAKNSKQASSKLEDVLVTSILMGTSLSKMAEEISSNFEFKYGSTSDKAIACIIPTIKGATNLAPLIPIIERFAGNISSNQALGLKISLNNDLNTCVIEDKSFMDLLFDGISFDILAKLSPNLKTRLIAAINHFGLFKKCQSVLTNLNLGSFETIINSVNSETEFDTTPILKAALR